MLLDLKTNLKSLKFGKDLPGGGNSNQPYLVSPIPNNTTNNGFVVKGGILEHSKDDFLRISRFFTDNKSFRATNFVLKQQLLSRTAVQTQASDGIFNDGIYNPLNTLAQVAGVGLGLHLPKQTRLKSGNDVFNVGYSAFVKPDQPIAENRLIKIFKEETRDKVNILSYEGGPGSKLGVGSTNIKYASNVKTGKNNKQGRIIKTYQAGLDMSDTDRSDIKSFNPIKTEGVSFIYGKIFNKIDLWDNYNTDGQRMWNDSVYSSFPLPNTTKTEQNNTNVSDQNQLQEFSNLNIDRNTKVFNPKVMDFRTSLRNNIYQSPDYKTKNIDIRLNLGTPGKHKYSYKYGKNISAIPLDIINAYPLYTSDTETKDHNTNDAVKFKIQIINQGVGNGKKKYTYIHFRAFLNNISDNYNSEWNVKRFVGRGENFYNYVGFDRRISLSWTTAAQSKAELIPMYQKLNFLASSLAPNYNDNGFMMGTLVKLTIGGYLHEVTGIINSLSYEIQEDTNWEIGLGSDGSNDPTVKELPHIIRVNNFSFTPIHNFIPALQKNSFDGQGNINKLGYERFISLADGVNGTNYDDIYAVPGKKDNIDVNKKGIKFKDVNTSPPAIIQEDNIYNANTNPITSPVKKFDGETFDQVRFNNSTTPPPIIKEE